MYFKNLEVFTLQDFQSMFGHFTKLCMKEFNKNGNYGRNIITISL